MKTVLIFRERVVFFCMTPSVFNLRQRQHLFIFLVDFGARSYSFTLLLHPACFRPCALFFSFFFFSPCFLVEECFLPYRALALLCCVVLVLVLDLILILVLVLVLVLILVLVPVLFSNPCSSCPNCLACFGN